MNTDDIHLDARQIAAVIDRTVPLDEQERFDAHLTQCAECRSELVAVSRLLRGHGAKHRFRFALPVAAAAALAFVVLTQWPGTGRPDDAIRSDTATALERAVRIEVLAPSDDAALGSRDVSFVWRAVAKDAAYRLTLTGASGAVVWTSTTSDTSLALPADVSLQRGASYFWYVDALRADGRSASTGVRRFTVP